MNSNGKQNGDAGPDISAISEFDDLLEIVGSNGKYQKIFLYGFIGPFIAILPLFFLNTIFLLSEPDHFCHVPGRLEGIAGGALEDIAGALENGSEYTLEAWKNLTIPREIGPDGIERFSQCKMFASSDNHTEIECLHGWDYDRSDYDGTIPSDYNWVCSKSDYVTQAFIAGAAGSGVGTIIFGWGGDKWGRKPFFFLCCLILAVFRFVSLFVPEYFTLFLACQFLTGSIFPMIYIIIFALAVEIFDKETRAWVYAFNWITWVAGICILPLIAWLTRHWYIFGLLTSLPAFLVLGAYSYVPESPRWLLTQNRFSDAEEILLRIAKVNGNYKKFQEGELQRVLQNVKINQDKRCEAQGNTTILSLFSNQRLAYNTMLLSIAWSINSIIYYGITLNTTSLAGNQFVNFFILAIIELPAGWIGGVLAEKTGRRWTQSALFLVSAIGFALAVVGGSNSHVSWLIIVSLVICKFCIATTSLIVTLQAAEIFPTNLRSSGNGFACSFSSVMAVCTPYIIYLGKEHISIPYGIFSALSIVGMIAASFLPETLNQTLPETTADGTELGQGVAYWSYLPQDYKIKDSQTNH